MAAIGAAALALAVFMGGYRYGEQHVTARWDAEKAAQAQAVAKQAAQVAAVTTHQTTIDQEISNEFETEKAKIVAAGRLAATVDFTFNLGAGRLQTSTPCRRVNHRDWPSAAKELRRWVYGAGKVLPGLVARREAGALLVYRV